MSTFNTLVSTAESAKIDRIILTIQPKGNGEANAIVHFAVDQQASMSQTKETNALRAALSKAIMATGTVSELEQQIADSLRRIESALGLGVEKYRAANTSDDVIKALMVASVATHEQAEGEDETADAPESAAETDQDIDDSGSVDGSLENMNIEL